MRESTIEKAVCDFARANGCLAIKNDGRGNVGKPDRLLLRQGKTLWLEFKAPGKKPTALQERWLKDLRDHGFTAEWVDSEVKGYNMVNKHLL